MVMEKRNYSFPIDFSANSRTAARNFESGTSFSIFTIIVIVTAAIVIFIFLGMCVRWIIEQRRYRELRHRLIPLYTFDPHEENDWDTEFLNVEKPSSSKSQDYASIDSRVPLNTNL